MLLATTCLFTWESHLLFVGWLVGWLVVCCCLFVVVPLIKCHNEISFCMFFPMDPGAVMLAWVIQVRTYYFYHDDHEHHQQTRRNAAQPSRQDKNKKAIS